MGLVNPRPAMRGREARLVQARLAHYDKRLKELLALGFPKSEADKAAFDEARKLQLKRGK